MRSAAYATILSSPKKKRSLRRDSLNNVGISETSLQTMAPHVPDRGRWRKTAVDVVILCLVALAISVALHWTALHEPYHFHDNWRQSPHWISPTRQAFLEDDLLLRYAEFNCSPFANLLYKTLARTGRDILWGKVNGILFFTLAVLLIYATARAMAGRLAGWAAASLFLFCLSCHFSGSSRG